MGRTCLTLDTPEARQALLRCYTLLLCLAKRKRKKTVDLGELGEQIQDGGNPTPGTEAECNEKIPV